ncbi:MAG: aminopeptidase [Verrucomicrobiia bacterium]|jgi:aminopeptidase
MTDPRYKKLAELLVGYSTEVQAGENVQLHMIDIPDEFTVELIRAVRKRKANPYVQLSHGKVLREIYKGTNEEHAALMKSIELGNMKKFQAYIAIRGAHNANESADVPGEKMAMYSKTLRPVQNYRVNNTKWVVLRWPTPSMAQAANMSTEAFEDFYFDVCTMNYAKMKRASAPLEKLMTKTNKVHIKGPGTDLRFSIKGMPGIICAGDRNVPDGEVFSCPVKDSVNGTIQYNTPTLYSGTRFENVKLTLENGKIIEATSSDTKRLNEILDTDPGARYIGEFSLGFNPYIKTPMTDILFDEKIAGSMHFTPGQAYEVCDNGNKSAVHWDMVLIQRPDYGGGEIWFDDTLIRKNGKFLPKTLQGLNPERLK